MPDHASLFKKLVLVGQMGRCTPSTVAETPPQQLRFFARHQLLSLEGQQRHHDVFRDAQIPWAYETARAEPAPRYDGPKGPASNASRREGPPAPTRKLRAQDWEAEVAKFCATVDKDGPTSGLRSVKVVDSIQQLDQLCTAPQAFPNVAATAGSMKKLDLLALPPLPEVTCFWFGQTKGPGIQNTVSKATGDKKPSTTTVLLPAEARWKSGKSTPYQTGSLGGRGFCSGAYTRST